MEISFSDRIKIPDETLISNLLEESVLLNLNTGRYFGLDDVGTRFYSVLTSAESIQSAYETLLNEYDVEGDVLRNDLVSIINELVDQGLIEITSE
jgi:hypothetical protein